MLENRYEVKASANFQNFEFVSVGSKGLVPKAVNYSHLEKNLFNLGFGDYNVKTGQLDDLAVSDNGDMEKVLATVAGTLYIFTDHHPNTFVTIAGSTRSRTRLYRIGISNNLTMIRRDFLIWGYADNTWNSFEKGVEYEGFLVKRKS
ncbi:DUF6934 family protein [Dyadobacter aurulentus]|uniref:DUF6934 family protein n=1 Tax=Dyadobacter sp. UC 10 TaxID=2605428 RepID=UPI0011F1137E|nr:hypothetical protein [Dyadobacter sp. UC 10]KAA0990987.1 hypothetical protein FXO21_12895 [Dyadobacter sp. UC 10]